MEPAAYLWAARLIALLHVGIILFVLFGAWFCRGRRWAMAVHLGFVANGLAIEIGQWHCPLSVLEWRWLERAGVADWRDDPFTAATGAILYPSWIPIPVLIAVMTVVMGWTLYVYFVHDRLFAPGDAGPPTPAGATAVATVDANRHEFG
jgi:hypothetical protein